MFLSELLLWLAQNVWALALHLSGRGGFPKPLTAAEEDALVGKMLKGDAEAKNTLIERNLRLVAHIAKKYGGMEQDDLISIGTIGLMKAVNTFKPDSGRLSSYASRCVENEMLMALRANRKRRNDVGLYEPIGTDKEGNEIHLSDILGTEKDEVSLAAEREIEFKRVLNRLNTDLTLQERRVLEMRYGLFGCKPLRQHEIAKALKISRSYVSRIEKRALEKLRDSLERTEDAQRHSEE